ncbi:hypothetical protein KBA39_10425 [Myxococcota bacterium]|nr:hypothetical protein [Myxococcota bacterium]
MYPTGISSPPADWHIDNLRTWIRALAAGNGCLRFGQVKRGIDRAEGAPADSKRSVAIHAYENRFPGPDNR